MFISKGCEILAVTLWIGVYLSGLLDFSDDILEIGVYLMGFRS